MAVLSCSPLYWYCSFEKLYFSLRWYGTFVFPAGSMSSICLMLASLFLHIRLRNVIRFFLISIFLQNHGELRSQSCSTLFTWYIFIRIIAFKFVKKPKAGPIIHSERMFFGFIRARTKPKLSFMLTKSSSFWLLNSFYGFNRTKYDFKSAHKLWVLVPEKN